MEGVRFDNVTLQQIVPGPDKLVGSPDAPLVIVELADVNCPGCRQIHPEVKKILENADGKIAYAFRSFPLVNIPGHEQSATAAILSEYAATQGKYMDFINACFEEGNSQNMKSKEGLLTVAKQVGLDPKASQEVADATHADAETFLTKVSDTITLARTTGILTTPTFILIGRGMKPKAFAAADLKSALSNEPYRSLLQ